MKVPIYCIVLLSPMAFAEDWTTSDGKTYSNVTVLKSDAQSVTILDKDGGARILLVNLPPDLQKRFNYTPLDQNVSAATANDTTPLKERPEWAQRLNQLASVLKEMKKEGGSFTSKGSIYNWKDITAIDPTAISYTTEAGTGKISFYNLPPELAKQLTLSADEVNKWTSDEAKRQQAINQIALNLKAKKEAVLRVEAEQYNAARDAREIIRQQMISKRDAEEVEQAKQAAAQKVTDDAAQAQQATQQAAQALQQATQQAAQALQAAQQAKAAGIAALQSQIDTLRAEESRLSANQRAEMEMQIGDLDRKLSALKYSNP